ncbi:MAG: hypothetical protein ACYCSO_05195 [Cuniculiplasma sp.]
MSTRKNGNGSRRSNSSPSRRKTDHKINTDFRSSRQGFHLKLKHFLGGVSLLSLLAAFEVFSIPAANGIIDFLTLTRVSAALVWFGVSITAGSISIILHKEEK